jgi:hypothetical protein
MDALDNFLRTDPRDVGCDRVMAALHVYADLTAAGHQPASMFPGMAAHLAACGSCREDFTGLLAAVMAVRARTAATGPPEGDPTR